jgi:hypothetical protein
MADRGAVVKMPGMLDEEQLMEEPYWAINVQTYPGDKNTPYNIEYYLEDADKTHNYDATAYNELRQLNAGGIYLMEGIDEALEA